MFFEYLSGDRDSVGVVTGECGAGMQDEWCCDDIVLRRGRGGICPSCLPQDADTRLRSSCILVVLCFIPTQGGRGPYYPEGRDRSVLVCVSVCVCIGGGEGQSVPHVQETAV